MEASPSLYTVILVAAVAFAFIAVRASRRSNGGKGWLGPMHAVLTALLVSDVVAILQVVFGQGQFPLGAIDAGELFPGELLQRREYHDLSPGMVTVTSGDPSVLWHALYATGHGLATGLAVIPMLLLARRLVRQAHEADPFTPDMVRRLRILGFMVLGGGALSHAVSYAASVALMRVALPAGLDRFEVRPDVGATAWWVLPGLLVLAFSEIVRRGCALRAELDEVI
ncbi:DUF2975 domain-containing protein [Longispora urticae]